MWTNPFLHRTLKIVTKHDKEKVIAPIITNALDISCEVLSGIDTDVLGTFSGEVDRKLSPIETLRAKCDLGLQVEGCDLVLATEGSFGNHPTIFYATAGEEWMMLKDAKHSLEITERVLTLQTNFNQAKISNLEELESFLEKVDFPSHYVILKASETDYVNMTKGIYDKKQLENVFHQYLPINGYCCIETDMRAFANPTRMQVLEELTKKLVQKIQSLCPACQCPGYGVVNYTTGLPCSSCKQPTRAILSHLYQCQQCSHTSSKNFPYGKEKEDPMYCDYCNP